MNNLFAVLVAALFCSTPLLAQTAPKEAPTAQQAAAAKWVTLKVTGITCAGCAGHIQKALTGKEGVLEHEVKYPGDQVKVKYDPRKIRQEDIQQAISALGYKAEPVEDLP